MKSLFGQLEPSLIWMTVGVLLFVGGLIVGALTNNWLLVVLGIVIGGLTAAVGVRKRSDWAKSRGTTNHIPR